MKLAPIDFLNKARLYVLMHFKALQKPLYTRDTVAAKKRVREKSVFLFLSISYSMPQRVGHASLGNLEVLHQKANSSTIVFIHCEQENEIT